MTDLDQPALRIVPVSFADASAFVAMWHRHRQAARPIPPCHPPQAEEPLVTDELLTYDQAAALVGVPECTVRQWKSRHRLEPAARIHGRPLFTAEAVIAADEHARTTPGGRHRKDAA